MTFRILYYDRVTSTNDLALKFAKEGAEEGTVLVAEFQTKGRGRFERTWVSPKSQGLLFSIILRPKLDAHSAPILTHLAAKSIAEVLQEDLSLEAKLKKPNDVLVKGKKIAGILTESSAVNRKIEHIVVGIGINVTTSSGKLLKTATSVLLETGKKVDKNGILQRVLDVFWAKYQDAQKGVKYRELEHAE